MGEGDVNNVEQVPPQGSISTTEESSSDFSDLGETPSSSSSSVVGDASSNYSTIVPSHTSTSDVVFLFRVSATSVKATFSGNSASTLEKSAADGTLTFPFLIGVVNQKLFIYGEEVLELQKLLGNGDTKMFQNQNSRYWNLGQYLAEMKVLDELIIIHDELVRVQYEIFTALFFKYVKNKVESESIDKLSGKDVNDSSSLILTVPLWFGSTQRQCLKQAGELCGFKHVCVINDVSMVVFRHINQFPVVLLSRKMKGVVLVFSEHGGNIDVAYYDYCVSLSSDECFLKMVSLSGNMYDSDISTRKGNTLNNIKAKFAENVTTKESDCVQEKQFAESLIQSLLFEATENYKKMKQDEPAFNTLDIVIISEQEKFKEFFTTATVRRFNRFHRIETICEDDDTNNNQMQSNWMQRLYAVTTKPNLMVDLMPYKFYKEEILKFKIQQVISEVKVHDILLGKGDQVSLFNSKELIVPICKLHCNTTYIFLQKGLRREFFIGHLEIKQIVFYKFYEVQVIFTVKNDGIFHFGGVHGFNLDKSVKSKLVEGVDFFWMSPNALGCDMNYLRNLFQSTLKSAEITEKKLIETKINLLKQCKLLQTKLFSGEGEISKISSSRKIKIESKIQNIYEAFSTKGASSVVLADVERLERVAELYGYFKTYL